jgi:hypothetical protein
MGLFGKSKEIVPCKVWKTRLESLKGVTMEAMSAVRSGNQAVIFTFFRDRQQECRNFFEENGIPFKEQAAGEGSAPSIVLLSATGLSSLQPSANVVLLFFGLHPMPGREERVAENFPNAKARWCCASLEDPMFKAFGMANVASLMETLGMKSGEAIEHRFVDKAISGAQEKLGAKVRNEIETVTEEEWFRRNISS